MLANGDAVSGDVVADLARRARRHALDRAAAEVWRAFEAAGIPSMLLKGPVTANALYEGEERYYSDVDLLVSPRQFEAASVVAAQLGFVAREFSTSAAGRWLTRRLEGQERTLIRESDGVALDLHRSFHMVPHTSDFFEVMWRNHTKLAVSGHTVAVPDAAGVGLVVMLHTKSAGHLAVAGARLSDDAARAVDRLPADVWVAVAERSRELGVERSVATALRERGGAKGSALAAMRFDGVEDDRWLRAHLRTGSVMAFQVCKVRQYSWSKRLLWMTTPFVPRLRPSASMRHQATSSGAPSRLRWLAAEIRSIVR
jgi:Uncharacterised nucleotidyltransferase